MQLGEGTVAVVTGAGSGIGLAMSHALAARGCSVVLADVPPFTVVAGVPAGVGRERDLRCKAPWLSVGELGDEFREKSEPG